MPAQKRCLSENLDDEEQHQHHAKQSRPHPQSLVDDEVIVDDDDDEAGQHLELQPQDQQVKEEDDEDEEGGGGGEEEEEDGDGDEAEDKQTVKQQQQQEKEKEENEEEEEEEEEDAEAEDSQGSPSSNLQEKPEFVFVQLTDIRKDVQCPICLGIIKKTRTVMECLHRFCRECIDKSMRMGNNECPACRTHCASRRSLRDDPNYDALIAALYPDIDKYEEEELAFHEEEMTRNKQIQASIAQILQRQSEALVKRRQLGNTPSTFTTRSQRNNRNTHSRRRNCRGIELQGSEDNEDENDNKDSSSADERGTELRQRRRKRRAGTRSSQPSSSAANSDGGCIENDLEVSRENRGISPGLVWNPEMLAWGRAGTRSRTAEVHNFSERRRRDKINKKMRALKEIIPNCSKVGRVSILDEAIEYTKTLQLQLKIMSMGAVAYMPPMMSPMLMQHINAPHLTHFSPMGAGMDMRMGTRMGFSPTQFPTSQVGATALPGITGTGFQMLGIPGQPFPMSVSHAPFIPLMGGPSTQSFLASGISGAAPTVECASLTSSKDSIENINSELMNNANTECSKIQTSSQLAATSVQKSIY